MAQSRRQRKKRAQAERLRQAAIDLFNTRGPAHTTMAAIAEAADVSEATVFNYLGSREALIRDLAARTQDALIARLDHYADAENALAAIDAFFRDSAGWLTESAAAPDALNPTALLFVLQTTAARGEDRHYRATLHQRVQALLQDGQRRGQITRRWQAGFLAEMVTGAFNEALTHWLMIPGYPLGVCLPQAGAFLSQALAATPSPRL